MRKFVFFVVAVLISTPTLSGSQAGKVLDIRVRDDGLHWFVLEGTHGGRPSCAKFSYWMIKDEQSVFGKSQFNMVLSAFMTGKAVIVEGAGSCTRWLDGEDVKTIRLAQ
jgi:hypothetical protein